MATIYIFIILILVVVVLLLSYMLLLLMKKATYMGDKDKEFILFAIDMFIEHSLEFKITSRDQVEKLNIELKKIRNKYFKKDETKS